MHGVYDISFTFFRFYLYYHRTVVSYISFPIVEAFYYSILRSITAFCIKNRLYFFFSFFCSIRGSD